jgi:hypothetical protein
MTEATAHTHSADIASTPKGTGQDGLVASAPKPPKTAGFTDLNVATTAVVRRQSTPHACLPTLRKIQTAFTTATPFPKSP